MRAILQLVYVLVQSNMHIRYRKLLVDATEVHQVSLKEFV